MSKITFTAVLIFALGMGVLIGATQTTYSQVTLGVRYHSGPLTIAAGNFAYYPYTYHTVNQHYSWPRHHKRHYNYYGHQRGSHRGWYRRGHRRHR